MHPSRRRVKMDTLMNRIKQRRLMHAGRRVETPTQQMSPNAQEQEEQSDDLSDDVYDDPSEDNSEEGLQERVPKGVPIVDFNGRPI